MTDATRTIIRAALAPESFILGLAACNFVAVWVASSAECMGYICPWYYAQNFAVLEPTRLLVAAALLRVGRAWGYSAAIALCAFILIQYVPYYADDYNRGLLLEYLIPTSPETFNPFLSLHTQNLLAAGVLVCAVLRWGRSAYRRGESLR